MIPTVLLASSCVITALTLIFIKRFAVGLFKLDRALANVTSNDREMAVSNDEIKNIFTARNEAKLNFNKSVFLTALTLLLFLPIMVCYKPYSIALVIYFSTALYIILTTILVINFHKKNETIELELHEVNYDGLKEIDRKRSNIKAMHDSGCSELHAAMNSLKTYMNSLGEQNRRICVFDLNIICHKHLEVLKLKDQVKYDDKHDHLVNDLKQIN